MHTTGLQLGPYTQGSRFGVPPLPLHTPARGLKETQALNIFGFWKCLEGPQRESRIAPRLVRNLSAGPGRGRFCGFSVVSRESQYG